MQWHSRRHSGNFVTQLSEFNSPRQRRWFAPTATGSKTTLPPKEISNRNSRRARVARFPPGQLIPFHQQVPRHYCPDQSAVEDAAGSKKIQRKQLPRVISIFRFREEHQNLRADQRTKEHPQTKAINLFARQPIARGELYRDQNGAQKRQR